MASKIGFTASAFDLFHAGHVMMLKEAKTQCDYLIVGLQVDPSIDRAWKSKPVQSIVERAILLNACRYVDEVVVYETEQDLIDILKTYPIDVRIIGEEYIDQEYTGKELDIKVYYNSRKHGLSSSELRQRIVQAATTKDTHD